MYRCPGSRAPPASFVQPRHERRRLRFALLSTEAMRAAGSARCSPRLTAPSFITVVGHLQKRRPPTAWRAPSSTLQIDRTRLCGLWFRQAEAANTTRQDSGLFDRDLLLALLCLHSLRQRDREHAILEIRLDLVGIDAIRHSTSPARASSGWASKGRRMQVNLGGKSCPANLLGVDHHERGCSADDHVIFLPAGYSPGRAPC